MQYLHVKNLENYNPGYTDRTLIWCKVYFSMINHSPDFEMLSEVDKWRYVCFIMLELQMKKPVPINNEYLIRKGFDVKKYPISLTIKMLHDLIEITEERNDSVTQSRVDKSRVEESRVDKSRVEESRVDMYVDFEKSTLAAWNSFCDKIPTLSKIISISDKRRSHLKKRFQQSEFKKFDEILAAIESQPFLIGANDREWKVSFDWLISNDTNFLKVIEKKYSNAKKESTLKKVDPDCPMCSGTGFAYNQEKEETEICECRAKK